MYWVQFHFQGICVSLTTIRYYELQLGQISEIKVDR